MSLRQIASRIGSNESMVRKWMQQYGIPRRTLSESDRLSPHRGPKLVVEPSSLQDLYWNMQLSQKQIAGRLDVSPAAIRGQMEKYGIPCRTPGESLQIAHRQGRVPYIKGPKHYRWAGNTRLDGRGYILEREPNHPRASHGFVRQHILIWERHYGRPLPDDWVIHHLNGIGEDNRLENLLGCPRGNHHYALLMQALKTRIRTLEAKVKALDSQRTLWDERKGG